MASAKILKKLDLVSAYHERLGEEDTTVLEQRSELPYWQHLTSEIAAVGGHDLGIGNFEDWPRAGLNDHVPFFHLGQLPHHRILGRLADWPRQ